MKHQYKRVGQSTDKVRPWWYDHDYYRGKWWVRNNNRYYLDYPYRGKSRIRTSNERRQNLRDFEYVRGKRRNLPTKWDKERISRDWGRSWKDYTKQDKQYNTGRSE